MRNPPPLSETPGFIRLTTDMLRNFDLPLPDVLLTPARVKGAARCVAAGVEYATKDSAKSDGAA